MRLKIINLIFIIMMVASSTLVSGASLGITVNDGTYYQNGQYSGLPTATIKIPGEESLRKVE